MPHGYTRVKSGTSEQRKTAESWRKPMGGKEFDIERSPQYQQALQSLQGLQGYYGDLMNPSGQAYQNFAAPEMRQFQEQIMPGIAEQFAGVGGLSSSGFQQTAGAAGASLAERLAALRSNLQMQGAQGMEGLAQRQMNFGMMPYEMRMKMAEFNQRRQEQFAGHDMYSLLKKEQKPNMWADLAQTGLTAAATAYGGPLGGAAANWTMNQFRKPAAQSTGFAPGASNQWVGP